MKKNYPLSNFNFFGRESLQILSQSFHPEFDPLQEFHGRNVWIHFADAVDKNTAYLFGKFWKKTYKVGLASHTLTYIFYSWTKFLCIFDEDIILEYLLIRKLLVSIYNIRPAKGLFETPALVLSYVTSTKTLQDWTVEWFSLVLVNQVRACTLRFDLIQLNLQCRIIIHLQNRAGVGNYFRPRDTLHLC